MHFSIQLACIEQIERLRRIELAALTLFEGHPAHASYAASTPSDVEPLAEAIAQGQLWVAEVDGEPVGFVGVGCEDEEASIAEMDVLPTHGRQGIGSALLEHACRWAAQAGYPSIVLGTLSDLAWNAPFYASRGFVPIPARQDTPALAAQRRHDRERGFPAHLRVFMRRDLAPLRDGWSRWPAPAKLNLFLRITGRRADGYHDLQTVFRLLDFGDEVRLKVRPDGAIRRVDALPGLAAEDDLLVRAARLLRQHTGTALGADIGVAKRIPMGGGLGGGSSDAATVLVALDALWGTGVDEAALAALGRQLGADVPVFVHGRSAWGEGIGEVLTPLALEPRCYVVLDPGEAVPTAALFAAAELTRSAVPATISSFVRGETTENAFEPVARVRHARVAAALDWLGGFGRARLSGTGGCVFMETATARQALKIARSCPHPFRAFVAAGVERSPLHAALARQRKVVSAGTVDGV